MVRHITFWYDILWYKPYMTHENEFHPKPEHTPETVESLRLLLEALYHDVAPYSDEHKALIHLLQYQRSKHRFAQAEKAFKKARKLEQYEPTIYESVLRKEEDSYIKEEVKVETINFIINSERLVNERYKTVSRKTQKLSERLERQYRRRKDNLPLAQVALDLTSVNEGILKKRHGKDGLH